MGAWDALEPKKSVPFCDRSVTLNVFGGPGGQCLMLRAQRVQIEERVQCWLAWDLGSVLSFRKPGFLSVSSWGPGNFLIFRML